MAINEISERLDVTEPASKLHLNFLESSYFIRIEDDKVDLTPGGASVIRSHKRT